MGQTLKDQQQMHGDPWDRETRETDKAWNAFRIYRNLGSARTLQKVADELGCTHQNVNAFSQRYDWVRRVRAYDAHIQGIVDAENIKEHTQQLREMSERHRTAAVQFQKTAFLMGVIVNAKLAKLAKPIIEGIEAGTAEADLPNIDIPKDLATFVKATGDIQGRAGDAEALALGVDRLMTMLEGGEQ